MSDVDRCLAKQSSKSDDKNIELDSEFDGEQDQSLTF